MRKSFFDKLHEMMEENKNIWLLTGDLGFGLLDGIKQDFPERFMNCGAAEQAMSDIAVGLALQGKIPFVYSITPFLLYRPFETLRNYIDHEKIPVKLIGAGRGEDYSHDGFSHWATDDFMLMSTFSNIKSFWPQTKEQAINLVEPCIADKMPWYINLRR